VEERILAHERKWEREHPNQLFSESQAAFTKRVLAMCRRLPKALIIKSQQSMHRRCADLAENGGEWIKGD